MAETQLLEVRVSRKLLLILLLVGLLFLIAGIEIGFTHFVIGPEVGQDKAVIKWLFVAIGILIGGAITANCFLYLFVPPVMLRVTKDKISFGTGFRYNLYDIPASFLEKVETYMRESNVEVNGKRSIVEGGTSFYFKSASEIPAQLTTSAGIQYYNYQLTISSTYADLGSKEVVEAVNGILGKS